MDESSQTYERRLGAAQSYFRDEMRRAVAWRDRLDRTSNWAVVMTATLLTWAFSKPENPHFVILIAVLTVTFFVLLEASRYRRYDVWRSRLRVIEAEILAPLFASGAECGPECWRLLADDLSQPSFKIPFLEALQRRLRRMHGPLLWLLLLSWVLKVGAFSEGASFVQRAKLGLVPGLAIVSGVGVYAGLLVLALAWPLKRRAMEALSEEEVDNNDWQEDPEGSDGGG